MIEFEFGFSETTTFKIGDSTLKNQMVSTIRGMTKTDTTEKEKLETMVDIYKRIQKINSEKGLKIKPGPCIDLHEDNKGFFKSSGIIADMTIQANRFQQWSDFKDLKLKTLNEGYASGEFIVIGTPDEKNY